MPLDQEHSSFLAPPPPFSETNASDFNLAPSTTIQPVADLSSLPSSSLAAPPFAEPSAELTPPTLNHKTGGRLTRKGNPKPKEKDLDPAEDIPTTAGNARVNCKWGTCTKEFRAGDWTAHVRTGNHRAEMVATQDKTGQVECLWKGCTARLQRGSMNRHVRALHVGTYEFRCKHCGATARGDSYVETHGLARDCPMRPSSSQPSPEVSASESASPASSSSSVSSLSSRHSRRFTPYPSRSTTSSEPSERMNEGAPQDLSLVAPSLSPCQHPLSQETETETSPRPPVAGLSTEAPPVNLPILAPQPIRPVRLEAFEQCLFQPPVPNVPEIAPTLSNPELSSLIPDWSALSLCQPPMLAPGVSAEDFALFSRLIASMSDFAASFPFSFVPDANL